MLDELIRNLPGLMLVYSAFILAVASPGPSNLQVMIRPILLLVAPMQKWFDQNITSRSPNPVSAASARSTRAFTSSR